MTSLNASQNLPTGPAGRELLTGQKLAFAAASLTLGVCSFISLLGMEKAILAIVFAVLALRNGGVRIPVRRGFARFGVALGILQIVLVCTFLILYWDRVLQFFDFVERFKATG